MEHERQPVPPERPGGNAGRGEGRVRVEPLGVVDVEHPGERPAERVVVGPGRAGIESGLPAQRRPAAPAIEVLEVETRLGEELGERAVAHPAELGDHSPPVDVEGGPDVLEDDLGRHPVELEVAAGGKGRDAPEDVVGEPTSAHTGEGPVAEVEAELGPLVPDEVEDREARLAVGEA